MAVIRQDNFIDSVADALQFISYYHPVDFVKAVNEAYEREQNPAARVVAFEELGMEAIYEFEVKDMPVSVAVDARGASIHEIGPRIWRAKIAEQAIEVA